MPGAVFLILTGYFVSQLQLNLLFRGAGPYIHTQRNFKGLPHDEFVEKIVDFYCATNYLHPFREGNGRTQRAFLTQLIRNAGYDINWAEVDGDLLMIATIQAPQGVTNLLQQVFLGQILINDNQ